LLGKVFSSEKKPKDSSNLFSLSLAVGGPWVWDLSLEPGHLVSSVYAADYSLPSGRCSFNHSTEVVCLYFTTVSVFANVNKNKSVTWPSESAMKG
jgi:hypothetical protein